MRVLVTGATGFVGRWTVAELRASGHEIVGPSDRVEITDAVAMQALVGEAAPDGVIHLAAVSYGPDATRDPDAALLVNARGTRTLLDSARDHAAAPAVVVVSSSDVYGAPAPVDLPLNETAPTQPASAYGRSKLEAERVAQGFAGSIPVAIVRPFNHTGPGQRREFVAPALASRILEARDAGRSEIVVGNVDVRRDIGDVRDLARALRLVLEGLAAGSLSSGTVLNVATGRSVAIRELIDRIAAIAGTSVEPRVDPKLVRATDPSEIVGDASRLRELTGWDPVIPLRQTLEDLVASLDGR